MSNPLSRLSTFRSYSYYHVLVMCDCSQTADAIASSTDLSIWDHATDSTQDPDQRSIPNLGPFAPKKLDAGGRYIVLINGSTDAAYTIEQARWTSSTGAQAAPNDRSTSIAIEGSITISEPKGVAFLDQVVQCCVALGVDSSQVVYVLKTFFVGENQFQTGDGSDYADTITDTPPVTFIVYDVTGTFTEAGGTYEMQFVAGGHGATRLPQYSKAVNAMSVTAGSSLASTLKALQDNINLSYDKYFQCVYDQIAQASSDSTDLLNALSKVKYVIEVGKDYSDDNGIKYTVTNQPQQYKNTAGCNDPSQLTFPPHTSIETAILTIMQMSPQVQADMAVGDKSTGVKYEFKVHTGLTSTIDNDGGASYTVYYRVERFVSPKTIVYDPAFKTLQKDDGQLQNDPNYARIKRNIIEFDYVYTGKNIDILEFDMKVNMGMAYLQTATLANTFKSQLERGPNRVMQPSAQSANSFASKFGSIVKIPVFFGSQIKASGLINSQNAGNAIQSAYTLTNHSSIEVAEATMRIVGNAELLGSINKTSSAEYVVKSADRDSDPTPATNVASFADWSHAPAYVKVNIMMPRDNDDYALYTGTSTSGDTSSQDYARPFWYDGYYYVVGIDHIFESGDFTQTLQMISLPKASAFDSTKNSQQQDQELGAGVGTCFDNQIGDDTATTPSTPTVPTTPPSGSTNPTNQADANTANNSTNGDPSSVKGWSNASPAVQTAIRNAATRYGVDVVTLAQFAAQESSFNPTATASPKSSATGLFQFLQGTYNGLVNAGKLPGAGLSTQDTHSGSGHDWSPPLPTDPRMDPQTSANAGAAFLRDNGSVIGSTDVGDLYLAHFLGAGDAKKIITDDKATGGGTSLQTALGSNYAAVAAANPSIVAKYTTTHELRTWAKTVMASKLTSVAAPAVAKQKKAVPPAAAANAPGTSKPSANPQDAKRTAGAALASQQNSAAQDKKDTNPCNTGPVKPQDTSTSPTNELNSNNATNQDGVYLPYAGDGVNFALGA